MMTLGSIGFLSPWLLLGLAALPAIWWLLRLTPPRPSHVAIETTWLLKDLKTTEETPAHSPWWLTLLRMLLAALIIFALAQPILNPDRQTLAGSGPGSPPAGRSPPGAGERPSSLAQVRAASSLRW